MVKQNIVFVENTPGSLQKVTKILAALFIILAAVLNLKVFA
jgi:preprotein translocase subunit SecG